MNHGHALRSFCLALPFLLAACGSDDQTGGLLNGGTVAKLSIIAPDEVESGTLQIEAGSVVTGFVAKLQSASGQPQPNRFVAIKLTPVLGTIDAPPSKASTNGDKTDNKGVVDFSYEAPEEVAAATDVTLVGSTTLTDGTKLTAEYLLTLVPAPPPVVVITGPTNVAPGIPNNGFRVTVSRKNGEQIPNACITVTTASGVISPTPTTSCSGDGAAGNLTDEAGVFAFTLTPSATIAKDTPLTITASTTVSGKTVTKSFVTTVRADTFQFTSPLPGTPIVVGSENAEPLHFQWTRSPQTPGGVQGVSGQLTLLISGGGRLVFNDDPFNESQSIVVNTSADASGDFTRPVAVSSNNSGQATITAREDGAGGRTTTLVVQFVDSPSEINLDATPLVLPISGRSNLLVTVLNQAGSPITGVDVVFLLTTPAGGGNERVFPQHQTTDASGQAKSQYEAGSVAGTARVQVRVEGGGLSNIREITVEAPAPVAIAAVPAP